MIERLAPPAGEDQTTTIDPGRTGSQPFFVLATLMLAQDRDGLAVDADDPGPAALCGSLNTLAPYDGG